MNTRTLTATLVATAIIVGVALVAPRASVAQVAMPPTPIPPVVVSDLTAAVGAAIASSVNEAIHDSTQAAAEIAREKDAAHDDSEQPTDDQPADS